MPIQRVPGGHWHVPSAVGIMPLKHEIDSEWNAWLHAGAFWTFWASLPESLPPGEYRQTQCVPW
jgi:hypothetical protein